MLSDLHYVMDASGLHADVAPYHSGTGACNGYTILTWMTSSIPLGSAPNLEVYILSI